jgi:hypothetical protein
MDVMNRMHKCFSQEIEEINEIEVETSDKSFSDLPALPGKSALVQASEFGAEEAGAEGIAHVIPYLDYVFFAWGHLSSVAGISRVSGKNKRGATTQMRLHKRSCEPVMD